MSETIFVIMCKTLHTGMDPFAYEAHRDRARARARVDELTEQNPSGHFSVLKTKLES